MVTSTMVTLDRETMETGWHLLDALDREGVDCEAMFWAEFSEGDWRLFLVSEHVGQEGSKPYLRDIYAASEKYLTKDEQDILFEATIVPLNPREPPIREIRARSVYGNQERSRDVPRRVNLIPGEVYIYRLRLP